MNIDNLQEQINKIHGNELIEILDSFPKPYYQIGCMVKYNNHIHLLSFANLKKGLPTIKSCINKEDYINDQLNQRALCKEYTTGSKSKVYFNCRLHGTVNKSLPQYRNNQSCTECNKQSLIVKGKLEALKSKTDSITLLNLCKKVHGNLYEYDLSTFKSRTSIANIKCRHHGWFTQCLNNHITSKQGCPKCGHIVRTANWAKVTHNNIYNKEELQKYNSKLYVIRLYNELESFIKVGISSRNLNNRLSRFQPLYKVEVLKVYKDTFDTVINEEMRIHNLFTSYKPIYKFGGSTECLYENDLTNILDAINISSISFNHDTTYRPSYKTNLTIATPN